MAQKSITLMIVVSLFALGACGKKSGNPSGKSISGAGASFPFPLYSLWAYRYQKAKGVQITYQSVGSGAGIAQIKKKTVDFGASDKPLKAAELKKYGLLQFPMAMGGVVPVVNIPGINGESLRLTGDVLAKIFLGEIDKWDHAAIAAINPGVKLPSLAIKVVHRADGSGTTWIFTNYLAKVSGDWKRKVGNGKSVKWPVGVGGKGNEGVAGIVKKIQGSIGYVEYAYSLQTKLPAVALSNKSGAFVKPNMQSFQAAAASADWKNAEGFYMVLTDQPGKDSWPITGATFILVYKEQQNAAQALSMLTYFDWCFQNGGEDAAKLHYIPIPDSVVGLIRSEWARSIRAGGKPVWK